MVVGEKVMTIAEQLKAGGKNEGKLEGKLEIAKQLLSEGAELALLLEYITADFFAGNSIKQYFKYLFINYLIIL